MAQTIVDGEVDSVALASFNLTTSLLLHLANKKVISGAELQSIYRQAIDLSAADEGSANWNAANILRLALESIDEA